jgi:hypothetical protein
MRKIFSLLLILLLVTTISSSVYHVAIDDIVYAQLYFQPMEEQPSNTFNNQPSNTFNNQPSNTFNNQPSNTFNNQPPQVQLSPQQTPIRKILWTSASWSNGNERTLESDQKDPYDSQFKRGGQGDRIWTIDGNGNAIIEQGGVQEHIYLPKTKMCNSLFLSSQTKV